ncbi:hypothetical protein ACHAXR_005895 [Thalassiosira sp. AJA248-18]
MYQQEKSEIQILKTYLLTQIPTTPLPPNDILLSPNSVALKAAIAGLDKELVRLEREERLVKKFTAGNDAAATAGTVGVNSGGVDDDADMGYVKMTKEDATARTNDAAAAMDDMKDEEEWEEASPAKKQHLQNNDEEQDLMDGQKAEFCQGLASAAVARIANANIKVNTPLGALGLALHTALVGLLDENSSGKNDDPIFRCTGVPDATVTSQFLGMDAKRGGGGGGGGFAPPVRELPRGQLVPPKWEDYADSVGDAAGVIVFRYKCGKEVYSTESGPTNDATTVYLALNFVTGNEEEVAVTFGTLPKDKSSNERKQMKLPIGQHVNLDGFAAAKAKNNDGGASSLVSPSLFYISLSELLMKFNSTFGVLIRRPAGQIVEESVVGMDMDVVGGQQTTLPMPPPSAKTTATDDFKVYRPHIPPDGVSVDTPNNHTDPLRVMDSQSRGRHGDFEGDLLPGGPQPGGLHSIPPRGAGSQVGPNHPMFDRTFGDGDDGYTHDDEFGGGFGNGGGPSFGIPGVGGGMGMRPRFDPFGPPGGPTEPGRGGRFPGRGSRLGSVRGRGGRGGRGRMPPGGFGNPNPDHMTPPNSDYFS